MKHKKIIVASVTLALFFSVCGYELGQYQASKAQENAVSYVGRAKNSKSQRDQLSSDKSPDEISKEEGISAEQIVVKITDEGYVTSHGDHYHYYNGKVPYDALISEDLLMIDPNYIFKKSDIVNEVKDGYIIKVDGKYYLYLKEGSKKTNLRTKEQIAEQAVKGAKEAESKKDGSVKGSKSHSTGATDQEIKAAKSQGRYTTDDGYIFSPDDVLEDTGDAYIVPHGNHFHYIPKSDLSASELAAAQVVWAAKSGKASGDKANINIYPAPVVTYGSHQSGSQNGGSGLGNIIVEHTSSLILYPSVSNSAISTPHHSEKQPSQPQKPITHADTNHVSYQELLQKLYNQPSNSRHYEDDGLVFDPNQVNKLTSRGFVVPHGDHWHVIPENHLSPLETYLAKMHLTGQSQVDKVTADKLLGLDVPKKPESPKSDEHKPELPKDNKGETNLLDGSIKKTKQGKDGKPYTTDDGYRFSVESIKSYDEGGIIADHGGHEHYIPYSELENSELKQVQNAINHKNSKINKVEAGHFTKEEIAKKLQYLSLQNSVPVGDFKVTGDKVIIPHGNHTHTAELKDIPTSLDPSQFDEKEDYETLIMQLKMGKITLDNHTKDVIRSGPDLIVYNENGTSKHIALNSIKLPLDYQEVDYSDVKVEKGPYDDKLDYIARQYHIPRTRLMVIGNIVRVKDKPSVLLDKVNINDDVIYTLRNDDLEKTTENSDHSDTINSNDIKITTDSEALEDTQISDQPNETLGNTQVAPDQPNEEPEENLYEKHLQELANQYGLSKSDFENRITQLALEYNVSMENIQFGTYLTFNSEGKTIRYDIIQQVIIN